MRTAYVHLGDKPLALFNMEHPGDYTFNLFKNKKAFLPLENTPIRDIDLTIDFHYGRKGSLEGIKSGYADCLSHHRQARRLCRADWRRHL